jgi:hypothetical protein
MWQVRNLTPFAAQQSWIRDRAGAEVWQVAVRGTFLIHPDGTTTVAQKQDPVVLAPVFTADPATSILLYDSDFHLTKPTTDVILLGHAYAPGGEPALRVDVTLRVGDLSKSLRVYGDRRYEKGALRVAIGSAQKFTRMAITYERSFGGREPEPLADPDRPQFDPRNPVGTGFAPVVGNLAPNVEYPGMSLGSRPAGFGPIPAHWHPRLKYAGTYDEAWQRERMPLYPNDLDDRFFLCSPDDQRPPAFLRGGEPVELLNLTPEGRMVFRLPRIALGFQTMFRGGGRERHRARLHTVIIEPDKSRVILVWRTELPCHPRVLKLQETVIRQKRVINAPAGPVALTRDSQE